MNLIEQYICKENDWLLLLCVLIVVSFCFFLIKFLFLLRKGFASKNWIPVEGEIIYRKLKGDKLTSFSYLRNNIFAYLFSFNWLKVKYEYNIDGEKLVGGRISYQAQVFREKNIDFVLQCEKYWPEEKVIVYYNPLNKKEAVLERKVGVSKDIINCMVATIIVLVLFFVVNRWYNNKL